MRRLLETKLAEDQQAQLVEWMLGGTAYHQCRLLVKEHFGLHVKSLSAFSDFWHAVCSPALLARRARLARSSDERAEAAKKQPGQFDVATIDAIKERAYQLSVSPHAKPADVRALFLLLQKARDHELAREQIALDRDRFAFNAAQACLKHLPALRQVAAQPALGERDKIEQIRALLFGPAAPHSAPATAAPNPKSKT
jgi:hypothetical protein